MRKKKFKPGDIVALPLPNCGVGCVRVIRTDEFGVLLELFADADSANVETTFINWNRITFAYVNQYSLDSWELIGNVPIDEKGLNIPPFFFGTTRFVTVQRPGKEDEFIRGSKTIFDEMLARGYIHKVLWLGNNIADSIAKKQSPKWGLPPL